MMKPTQNGAQPRREFREFKFIITPVLLVVDEDGQAVAEQAGDPVAVYKVDGLREFIDRFPGDLETLNASVVA